jgi:hypothetical protein
MKMQKLVIAMLLIVGTVYGQEKAKPELKMLHWLSGTWERTHLKQGEMAQESWTITSPEKLTGSGITKKDNKIVFEEKLALTYKDSQLYYVADVTGNEKPVWFKVTAISDHHFVCENSANDFPKKIVYTLTGDQLLAVISAGSKHIDYHFVKKQ